MPTVTKQSLKELLEHLPGDILLSIALNDATPERNRKAAVEIMLEHDFPQVNHRDLAAVLTEVKADHDAHREVTDIVETASEQPLEKKPKGRGASVAGVTTQTLSVGE